MPSARPWASSTSASAFSRTLLILSSTTHQTAMIAPRMPTTAAKASSVIGVCMALPPAAALFAGRDLEAEVRLDDLAELLFAGAELADRVRHGVLEIGDAGIDRDLGVDGRKRSREAERPAG